MPKFQSLTRELLRRKVVRVVAAYLAMFWAVTLGVASIESALDLPDIVLTAVMIAGIAGIPLVAFLTWRYDIVPPQLVRDVKDLEAENPGLSWARVRHEVGDAGYVLLAWTTADGARTEKRFYMPVSIGREMNNDIVLADDRVSRHHAVLWAANGIWQIRDMDSANGTFVDQARVTGTSALPQACDLRFHINGPVVGVRVDKASETRIG